MFQVAFHDWLNDPHSSGIMSLFTSLELWTHQRRGFSIMNEWARRILRTLGDYKKWNAELLQEVSAAKLVIEGPFSITVFDKLHRQVHTETATPVLEGMISLESKWLPDALGVVRSIRNGVCPNNCDVRMLRQSKQSLVKWTDKTIRALTNLQVFAHTHKTAAELFVKKHRSSRKTWCQI
jgi:hypothetical protein